MPCAKTTRVVTTPRAGPDCKSYLLGGPFQFLVFQLAAAQTSRRWPRRLRAGGIARNRKPFRVFLAQVLEHRPADRITH